MYPVSAAVLYILLLLALIDGNWCMYAVVCWLRYSMHEFSCTDLLKAVVCTLLCANKGTLYTLLVNSLSGVTSSLSRQ